MIKQIIPDTFKVELGDKLSYFMQDVSDMALHMVLKLEAKIDEAIFERAVRLSLDAEPILGCYLETRHYNLYWKRHKDLDNRKLVLVETNTGNELDKFIKKKIDPFTDVIIQCIIIQGEKDIICIKTHHCIMDVGGLKEYISLLAGIYNHLCMDPNYLPKVNQGKRGLGQISKHLSFFDKLKILRHVYRDYQIVSNPKDILNFSKVEGNINEKQWVIRQFDPHLFNLLKKYGSAQKATINDIFITLLIVALLKFSQSNIKPVRILSTIDYRSRYTPTGRVGAIGNFSGIAHINIYPKSGYTFDDILHQVTHEVDTLKKDYIGLFFLPLAHLLDLFPHKKLFGFLNKKFETGFSHASIEMSNFGRIDKELSFNGIGMDDAYLVSSVNYHDFLFTFSSFKDKLTFCVGFIVPEKYKNDVEKIFDYIEEDIKLLCNSMTN
jgi:NRPS condensation-like uncharacterized protein